MQVKTQPEDFENYLTDASNLKGGHAAKLFIPESISDISQILREANENNVPVTIAGARTGTVGGAIPFGGIIVSLEKLNKIKNIDKNDRHATAEPGVILGDFVKAVENEEMFYPPDPTEWSCQLGGTVATNASGARSFRYGSTRKYVQALKVVLPGGDILDIERGAVTAEKGLISLTSNQRNTYTLKIPTYLSPNVRKNVSGYFTGDDLDPIDLFIGSEGTLGVIAEIKFAVLPKPQGFFSGIVFFEVQGDLLNFVDDVRQFSFAKRSCTPTLSGLPIDATLLEYFDDKSLQFISEKFPDIPARAVGAIFFEQETNAANEDEFFEYWNTLLEKHNADLEKSWFTTNEQDRDKMREFRHSLPVSVNEKIALNKQRKIGTDMAVPDENFKGFLAFYKRLLNESGLEYLIFGHIGDNHLHANILPKNDWEAEKARHLYGRFIAQSIMLGGTISAEHGIGKLKSKYLNVMMGERYLNEMAEIKRAFDPRGILGRGNMFDEKILG
ncbi:MAG: FAD-binding oxidoreductase [Pyrinomonadaceae bacterium]